MNENEVYELLQAGHLTMTVDTNVLYEINSFIKLCNKCNKINEMPEYEIKIVISSLVHAEKLFDLKQDYGEQYDIDHIIKVLESKKVSIAPFEYHHAEAVAQLIGTQFPTVEEWRKFKRQECMNCLGISRKTQYDIPGSGKECGATVDWLIAGYAHAENYLLITHDKGNEFKPIKKKTTLKILEKALMRIQVK
ncbi:MAG TPA: hypothetical protein EYP59_07035 [Thiotrichaceae bacterium]|nr:hypothetical protein [Thiotrichaceae bacterium]